jgi:hypothetical protein
LIEGFVTRDGIPSIHADDGGQKWEATIDTGFNGALELPEQLRPYLNARRRGKVTSLLAANQRQPSLPHSLVSSRGRPDHGLARPRL